MVTSIAIICVLPVLTVFLLFFTEKPTVIFKDFRKKHPNFQYFNIIAYIILGIIVTALIDKIDFSDMLFNDYREIIQQKENLIKDVKNVYSIEKEAKISITNRLNTILDYRAAQNNDMYKYVYPTLLCILLTIYLALIVLNAKSESSIEKEIKNLKKKNKEKDIKEIKNLTIYNHVTMILSQLQIYKIAKIERLKKELEKNSFATKKCKLCKAIFSPELQLKIIIKCMLTVLNKQYPNIQTEYYRIGIFVPDINKEFLTVIVSIDNRNQYNVIKSPNEKKHRDKFKLDKTYQQSLATKVFYSKKIEVVSNCDNQGSFARYTQEQEENIKSVVISPLKMVDKKTIGVLVIDSNSPGIFSEDDTFFIEILSQHTAYWVHHERLLSQYFGEC